jgi:hypothetical protein
MGVGYDVTTVGDDKTGTDDLVGWTPRFLHCTHADDTGLDAIDGGGQVGAAGAGWQKQGAKCQQRRQQPQTPFYSCVNICHDDTLELEQTGAIDSIGLEM